MALWGTPGPPVHFGFHDGVVVGDKIDIVATIDSVAGPVAFVTLYPGRQHGRIVGIQDIPAECFSVSALNANVVALAPCPTFQVDDPTDLLFHGKSNMEDHMQLVELCAGMGIGTIGFEAAGMTPVAAVDWSKPMTEAYQAMHPNVPVIHGDINCTATIKQLYKAHPRPAVVMCGFSCQPFSTGGAQRGAEDQRSTTLGAALRIAYVLRSRVVILECVQDASTNAMVRRQVEAFRDQCQFHLSEAILRLEDIWVSRRSRWWAVLSVGLLGPVCIRAFDPLPEPSKPMDLLPAPMAMSPEHLAQLELTGEELELFLSYQPRLSKMFLSRSGKAPTALHSWGSQVTKCECLCRSSGFSHETLMSRGLYGLLFPVGGDPNPDHPDLMRVRHPHPTEVAVLTGVPEMIWPSNLRLCLAGLGQQASPLHSVWVGATLQHHVESVFMGQSNLVPLDCLEEIRGRVSVIAEHLDFSFIPKEPLPEPPVETSMDLHLDDTSLTPWVHFSHHGGPNEVTVVHSTDRVPFVTALSDPGTTVVSVVQATCNVLGYPKSDCKVVDCSSGLTLAPNHPASGLCLWTFCEPVPVPDPQEDTGISPTVEWQADAPECQPASGVVPLCTDLVPVRLTPEHGPEILVEMDSSRLRLMVEPSVPDVSFVTALRKQPMNVAARKQVLANQGTLWADDELLWHMDQLLQAARKPTWAILDPLLAAEALKRPSHGLISQWIQTLPYRPTAIIGVVCVDHHWIPFLWTWTVHCVIASCWDVPGPPAPGLSTLHQSIATAVGSRSWTVHAVTRSFAITEYCGLCAIRFIDHMLRGKMLPMNLDDVKQLHATARSMYVQFLDSCASVCRPWIWAAGLEPKAFDRLQALLLEHGVDPLQLKNRANLLIQAIGLPTVQNALTSGQPWRSLKSSANKCRPVFQLVLPEELEQVVQKKAEQGGIRTKRKKQQNPSKPVAKPDVPKALDPSKLVIDGDTFNLPDGTSLVQLQMSAIGPLAQGVILTTPDEASAYLKAGQLVSKGGLALLLINADEAQLSTTLSWSFLRAVLRCQANSEPMIVPAYLVQIGQVVVVPKSDHGPCDVLHAPAACCKIAVYRDLVEGDWNKVVKAPVKFVLAHLAPLQVCRQGTLQSPCSCLKWHPADDAVVEDPVLDVWRRQWVSMSFRPVSPEQADVFLFNMRFLDSLSQRVLSCSGRHGIFIEPRSLDARDPLLSYQVLWLPKTPLEELFRVQQCTPQVIGLARLGSRLGVRSKVEDAPALAKQLKPGSIFLAAGTKGTYELGPLPFGMDRLTVSRLCSQWGWQARPLHPSRSVDGALGNLWLVQASTPPPTTVARYQGAEVVITKVQDRQDSAPAGSPPSQVIGSSTTVQLCAKSTTAPATDPWLIHDPWGSGPSAPVSAPVDHTAVLRDFEARLESKLLAKLPTDMDVDSQSQTEARFAALEHQVQSLVMNHQTLEAKIDENAVRADNQLAAVQAQVSHQLDSQGQHMQAPFCLPNAADRSAPVEETQDGMMVSPRPCSLQGSWPCISDLAGFLALDFGHLHWILLWIPWTV